MATNPLVRSLNLQDLIDRDAAQTPQAITIDNDGALSSLAGHIRLSWSRNKLAKVKIDQKLLGCLRARRRIYSAAEIDQMTQAGSGMNFVYDDLTETKCRAASAWIREIVLPVGERPWAAEPTPVPDLPMPIKMMVTNAALQQAQAMMVQRAQAQQAPQPGDPGPQASPAAIATPGAAQPGGAPPQPQPGQAQTPPQAQQAPPPPGPMSREEFRQLALTLGDKLRDDAEKEYTRIAKLRAVRMERVIADRMAEGNYDKAVDAFVENFVTYPAAILKGPFYSRKKKLHWGAGWQPEVTNNPCQTWATPSPFDVYPAPGSDDPQKGDFIERIRFLRSELHDLKGLPNYKDDQIDGALMDYTNGHLEAWLWTEAERQRLEKDTLYMWLSPPGVIDALNFWGSVPGWMLMSWGVPGDLEPTQEYECNAVICGRYVLYAALNPDPVGGRPYHKACYDEIPGAFWGNSIPDLASTCQKMCNAISSAQADNFSMASGPMVWFHMDRLADGETAEVFPWRSIQMKSDPTQGVNPGVGFFQPEDRSAALDAAHDKWALRADDATGIPRYTYGNERAGGSADTATGLSMLMNNAAKGLRRAISNVDLNVIQPTVNSAFVHEMLYNPDQSIKGDCYITPRGAAAILIKESAQQRRIQFLQLSMNPIIAPILGAKGIASIMREIATSMELPVDDIVPTEEEVEQQAAMQQQMQQEQMQAQQNQAQQVMALKADEAQIKEKAIGQREAQGKQVDMISNIVQQAVSAHFTRQQPPPASGNVVPLKRKG